MEIEGFEREFPFTPFVEGCEAAVEVWQAQEDARAGTRCAGLSFSVRSGRGTVALRGNLPLPGKAERIHLWVRGDASQVSVVARIEDAGGETHSVPLGRVDFAGWRRLEGHLLRPGSHFGGDDNGRIDFPIRLTHLCIQDVEAGQAGVVYFDALAVTTALHPEEQVTVTLAPGGRIAVFEAGKPVDVLLRARNLLSNPATLNYHWQLAEGQGEKPASGSGGFLVPPGGSSDQKISLPAKRVGLYMVSATALRPGGPACRARLLLAVVPPAPNRDSVQVSRLGLNIPGPLSEAERALVRLTGAGWVRIPVRWADIEKGRGLYTLDPALDATIRDLARAGIRVVPSLCPENRLYPEGAESVAAFGRFCHELARRVAGPEGVRTWEIAYPTPGPVGVSGAHPDLLDAAATAIVESDPDALFFTANAGESVPRVLPAPAGVPADGRHSAGVSGLLSCRRAPGDHPALALMPEVASAKRGATRPLYLATLAPQGEVADLGSDAAGAAGRLARALLGGLADDRIDALFLGGLKESGPASLPTGLAAGDLSPTPALLAYRTLAGVLQGARPKGRIEESFVRGYLFEEGRDTLVALWSPPGDAAIAVGSSAAKVAVTDLLGSVREHTCREGVAVIPVGPLPCYFRIPGGRLALEPMLLVPEGTVVCRPGKVARASVRLRNPFRTLSPGMLRLVCPTGWRGQVGYPVAARRGQVQSIEILVTPPGEADPGAYEMELWIDVGSGDPVRARVLLRVDPDGKEAASGAPNP